MKEEDEFKEGELVHLNHWPDRTDRCPFSGSPRFRKAMGVVLEIFTEYDGSRNRMKLLVEGTEYYCMKWELRKVPDESR